MTIKIIAPHQFGDFHDYDALFFIEEGIIIDYRMHTPFIKFSEGLRDLPLNNVVVYLADTTLIIQGQIPFIQPDQPLAPPYGVNSVKQFLSEASGSIQSSILTSTHWLTWNANTIFCTTCGGKLHKVHDKAEKKCDLCALSQFPNLSPAIMVLIQRNDEVLLARSSHFKPGFYSALAGFIDLGESAEEAVHREVKEEVGLEVTQLEYFGSQSWPFPNSFMIAFKAQYLKGDLKIDPHEIEDAQWFKIDNLPQLPPSASISRQLIDSLIR